MKGLRYFAAIALLYLATFVSAEGLVVTNFLGIPIDGSKSAMREKIISKGFVPKYYEGIETLEGNFNGQTVNVDIVTYKDKVCRICVFDSNTLSAAEIKTRFNTLVYQFEHNGKYRVLNDYTIPDDVDIEYEMNVNKKSFQALYLQLDLTKQENEIDTLSFLSDEDLQMREMSDSIRAEYKSQRDMLKSIVRVHDLMNRQFEMNRPVWFSISQFEGKYYISMFYDNEYNRPHGEDL